MLEQYYLLLQNKESLTAFYNDKTMLLSSFTGTFETITKPIASQNDAKNLNEAIKQMIFILNRYYFVKKVDIIDECENVIITVQRNDLQAFLKFYKGD